MRNDNDHNVREEWMTAEFSGDPAPDDPPRDAANDDAFARLEKEMMAMKNAIGGLSGQIAEAASDIGAAAQDQAKRGLNHARAHGDPIAAADASGRVGAIARTAQMEASSIGETLEDVIRERPLSMAAIALGLGFLLGVAWRR
jgi:ElaB/YqjD/DUF883 family membrane-anchored ribosome-binding protein